MNGGLREDVGREVKELSSEGGRRASIKTYGHGRGRTAFSDTLLSLDQAAKPDSGFGSWNIGWAGRKFQLRIEY